MYSTQVFFKTSNAKVDMYRVLIVDEEEHLLWALEKNLVPDREDIQVITANTGELGFETLRAGGIDLLICDIKMPGKIDGFQLILRAKEVAPEARVVIMTAFGTQRIQNFADRIGVTHYIEKPFNVSELRDVVLEILNEKEGFQGVLSDLELTDIIQMLCLARRTALLHLKHREHRGKIVFDKGDVVHSEFDQLVGEEAVYRMLGLKQGDIFMQSDFRVEERTITTGWQDLLFEGLRRADERNLTDDDEEESNTDVGMRVSDPQITRIITESELDSIEINDDDDEKAFPFFSDQELEEIEKASEAVVDGESEAFVAERPVTQESIRPTVIAREEDEEFRSPFRAPRGALDEVSEVPKMFRSAPNGGFRSALDAFKSECPGLVVTGLVSPKDGLGLHFAGSRNHPYDPDTTPVFFADVVLAAQRVVGVLNASDTLKEIQIALDREFILLRVVEGTPYLHFAVVSKDTSLGVALVLMRRFQKTIQTELGAI
jgi:DNA-binding response OmpR family regulator